MAKSKKLLKGISTLKAIAILVVIAIVLAAIFLWFRQYTEPKEGVKDIKIEKPSVESESL